MDLIDSIQGLSKQNAAKLKRSVQYFYEQVVLDNGAIEGGECGPAQRVIFSIILVFLCIFLMYKYQEFLNQLIFQGKETAESAVDTVQEEIRKTKKSCENLYMQKYNETDINLSPIERDEFATNQVIQNSTCYAFYKGKSVAEQAPDAVMSYASYRYFTIENFLTIVQSINDRLFAWLQGKKLKPEEVALTDWINYVLITIPIIFVKKIYYLLYTIIYDNIAIQKLCDGFFAGSIGIIKILWQLISKIVVAFIFNFLIPGNYGQMVKLTLEESFKKFMEYWTSKQEIKAKEEPPRQIIIVPRGRSSSRGVSRARSGRPSSRGRR